MCVCLFFAVEVCRQLPGSHLLHCFGGALVLASFGASPRSFGDRLSCEFLRMRGGELRPWGQETMPWATFNQQTKWHLFGRNQKHTFHNSFFFNYKTRNTLLKITANVSGHFLFVKRSWILFIVKVINYYTCGYSAVWMIGDLTSVHTSSKNHIRTSCFKVIAKIA